MTELGEDEIPLLIIAFIGTALTFAFWGSFLSNGHPFRSNTRLRQMPLGAAVLGLGIIFIALLMWADDEVRNEPIYLLLLTGLGLLAQTLAGFILPSIFGLSHREDIQINNNAAASHALTGLLLATSLSYAGANVGEGPSLWNNVFSALLSIGGIFLVWIIVQALGGITISITQERDSASGLRLGAIFTGAGLVFARAVAGDWISTSHTTTDFFRLGWPMFVLAIIAGVSERKLRPSIRNPFPSFTAHGIVPSVIYILMAAGYTLYLGHWRTP